MPREGCRGFCGASKIADTAHLAIHRAGIIHPLGSRAPRGHIAQAVARDDMPLRALALTLIVAGKRMA